MEDEMMEFTKVLIMTLLVIFACFFLFGVTGTLAVGESESIETQIAELQAKVLRLEEEMQINIVGDCINEGILRTALGANPIDLNGCIDERREWYRSITEDDTSY